MGCDGGSIPTRVELVKVKKKEEQRDNTEVEQFKWHFCALSKEPLKSPIVCCKLGNLFLKEAVIMRLLEKSLPSEFAHIKSLKDLQPVNFTPNPAWEEKPVLSYVTSGNGPSPFICPITGLEVNGHHSFSVLKRCGCVFSDRALKEVPSAECLICRQPYSSEDIQPLNPKPEVREQLLRALAEEKAKRKEEVEEKRNKKERKQKAHKDKKEKGTKRKAKDTKKEAQAVKQKKMKTDNTKNATGEDAGSAGARCSEAYRSIFISSTKEKKPSTFTHYA